MIEVNKISLSSSRGSAVSGSLSRETFIHRESVLWEQYVLNANSKGIFVGTVSPNFIEVNRVQAPTIITKVRKLFLDRISY